jgi:uridine kinase
MHIAFVQPSQRYADIIIPRGHHTVSTGVVVQMIRQAIAEQNAAKEINNNSKKEDLYHE